MGRSKFLKQLRKDSRKQIREALPSMIKPEPKNVFHRWIFHLALRIVMRSPEKVVK